MTAPTPKEQQIDDVIFRVKTRSQISSDAKILVEAFAELRAERDAAVRDAAIVREIRARRNVVVEVSPELLDADVWSDEPLHVLLTKNTDRAHLLTFRESDELRSLRARTAACVSACESAIVELACDDKDSIGHWCATCDSHVDVNGTVRDQLRAAVATAQGE